MGFRRILPLVIVTFLTLFLAPLLVAQTQDYTVKKGDTLYGLARQYGITVTALQTLNKLGSADTLRIGQVIKVPADASTEPSVAASPSPKDEKTSTYTVAKGDTLYGIARKLTLPINTLLSANRLNKSSTIKIGQVLTVPGTTENASGRDPSNSVKAAPALAANGDTGPAPSPVVLNLDPVPHTEKTMLDVVPYTQGAGISWPHSGDRFAMSGKLPGIVIKAPKGDAVKAVASGRVSYSGPNATLGHIVIVQNSDRYFFIYGGNSDSPLKNGDLVKVGDQIGTVGVSPGIQEPQIYFSVVRDGVYVDPASAPRY